MPDCHGSDGSPYYFFVKKGSSDDLLVSFSGGGVAWDEYSAGKPGGVVATIFGKEGYYFPSASICRLLMFRSGGVRALNDPANPFDTWNVVHIPYCTADFHAGRNEIVYGKNGSKRCHMGGEANTQAVMDRVKALFPMAKRLVISGESAGGYGCVAQGDTVASRYPEAQQVTVISDGTQLLDPVWKKTAAEIWKTRPQLHECLGEEGDLIGDWFVRLSGQLNARYLHIVSPQDDVLIQFQSKIGGGPFEITPDGRKQFVRGLKKTVQRMVAEVPTYRCYIGEFERNEKTDTTAHTTLGSTKRLNATPPQGPSLLEWIRNAIDGEDIPNVGLGLLEEYVEKYAP